MTKNAMKTVPPARKPLMLSRRFAPLFTLFQTGTFNDNALKNALIALITFGGMTFLPELNSAIRVPVAALIFTGPFLIFCAIAGQIACCVTRIRPFPDVARYVDNTKIIFAIIATALQFRF